VITTNKNGISYSWLENVELVDPNCDIKAPWAEEASNKEQKSEQEEEEEAKIIGWGSEEGTQLLVIIF
jgi:hypothetical protein